MKALHLFFAANLLALTPLASAAKEEPKKQKKPAAEAAAEPKTKKTETPAGHVFAWPFIEFKDMIPRGGSSKGSDVTLLTGSKDAWKKLNEPGLSQFEQDRRAILALAGSYRVGFDFTESLGLTENFKPSRPYFSWATENVTVLEDRGEFISLQHSLVMYFKNEKGETEGPAVMKHWRQDWTFQPTELHVFIGNRTFQRTPVTNTAGRWSQSVFQVDDSPRYQVLGTWTHDGVLHEWRSDNCPRPLPRRENSVRADYNVLEGFHDITLTPNGWVHIQNNRKLQVDPDGKRTYLGAEIGVDRYEEITKPDLATSFGKYWEKTGDYWKDVRDTWTATLKANDKFALKNEDDGEKLYAIHFEYAGELEKSDKPADPAANLKHAQDTIQRFLEPAAK